MYTLLSFHFNTCREHFTNKKYLLICFQKLGGKVLCIGVYTTACLYTNMLIIIMTKLRECVERSRI